MGTQNSYFFYYTAWLAAIAIMETLVQEVVQAKDLPSR